MNSYSFCDQGMPWSKARLLSYVINAGSKYSRIDQMQRAVEEHFVHFDHILQTDEAQLRSIHGIGPVKARQIMALLEWHKAMNTPEQLPEVIRKSGDATHYFQGLKNLSHEEFHILLLNRAHIPLMCKRVSQGGITGTVTDIRLILREALTQRSTAMIVAHNHPSGALVPSENDKRMTEKLAKASELLDIKLLDHLIVTRSGYFSFPDQGLL